MKTKEITPEQYAKTYIAKKGKNKGKPVSTQYIHKILKDGKGLELPNVATVNNYSRFYTLTVPASLNTD